jgi:cation diffusion facilitator family transporter
MRECDHLRWEQSHDYRPLESTAERQAWLVAALTGATMLVEILAGYWFNSMALLADGWHMASHMVAISLTALAYLLARRYARDQRFAFGTWKIEILAGFASAVLLLVVIVIMAVESVWRLWQPTTIGFDQALWVAGVGLLVNLASAWLLRDRHEHAHGHGHAHPHAHAHSHEPSLAEPEHSAPGAGRDLNRHAAFIHVLADALTSVAAILALFGGKVFGWNWLDPCMGLVGAVIIGVWVKGLLLETGKVLIDREMDDPLVARVRHSLEQLEDTEVSDLHLWRVGRAQFACIVSVVTHGSRSAEVYKAGLKPFGELVHVTVEVNRCNGRGHGTMESEAAG